VSPSTRRGGGPVAALTVLLAAAGCATTTDDTQRTIEPSAGGSGSSGAAGAAGGDSDFVLSRKPSGPAKPAPEQVLPHIGDKWWKFRADFLGISESEARDRDAAISGDRAPSGFWDKQTATETVAIWGSLCNECHGGRRRLRDAMVMPGPGQSWGRGDGLFFGNRRDYAAVFATVNQGGAPRDGVRSQMPAWVGKLAREEMWALLYFLEFQSGGIEGRFPPSLYPRTLENRQ
jgi:hypothetical protein